MDSSSQEPVIDWELALKLAGNNRELAVDMLKLFVKALPDEMNAIIQANSVHNTSELLIHLHKLRGGLSYCGLPRLRKTLVAYENEAKKGKTTHLPELFQAFEYEVTQVIDHVGRL